MKKYILFVILLSFLSGINANSQWRADGVPSYIRADYFEQFPDFYKYPINGKLRHYQATPEELKFVPDQTKFLTNDGIEVINLSSSFPNAKTETWMAINPSNPNNLVATCNDNAFLGGAGGFKMSAFVTTDGARNWTHRPTPANTGQWITPSGNQATIFDPAVTFDSKGNVYYAYGFSETSWGSEDKDTEKNGVFVVKSTNGGTTWDALTQGSPNGIVAISTDGLKPSGNPFHDRYTIGADITEGSKYKDNIYITWRVFRGQDGVVFSRSTDGGETWSNYRRIAYGGQAPQPVTGPNGEVYVTWIDYDISGYSRAMFIKSTDAGSSFGTPIEAQKVMSIGDRHATSGRYVLKSKQDIRVSSVPQMVSDNSKSPYRGNLYIVQAGRENSGGKYGVYFAKSTNQGSSWAKNIRIDNSTLRNDLFFPSIACDPVTGLISVLYYSSQNDPNNVGVDAYVAISNDGGDTWKHLRVTPNTFYLNQQSTVFPQGGAGNIYWGDYTHIVSYNSRIFPLYWAPTSQNYSYGTNAMFTAFISPAPQQPFNPEFITMITPTKLKITWVHPTKNLLGEDLGNFKINIYKGETKIGEVAKNATPEFFDENVVYGQNYTYYLETELTDGLKSARNVINALVGGNPKPKPPTELTWRPVPNGIQLTWKNPSQTVMDQPFLDNLKIAVYNAKNGTLIEKFGDSEFIAGGMSSHTVALDPDMFYEINVKAVGVRGSVETESDTTQRVVAYAGVPKSEFDETFDIPQNRVPVFIKGGWATSTAKAASSPNSFTDSPTGNYPVQSFEYFIMAPVILSSGKSTLNFDHIALIDTTVRPDKNGNPSYDYGEISYSNDFGVTWKLLKWVNSSNSEYFFMGNLDASQWQELAFNLSSKTGDTVLFRFALGSNDFKVGDGWYLDNIRMNDKPSSVNYNQYDMTMISVSPNPVRSIAKVALKTAVDADIRIELYDVLGNKIIYDNKGILPQGDYFFDYDLKDLSEGMYYYRINIGNHSKMIPISVTR
ncbi:MAG: T9SS type A sorting domain-containing protein [Candidatus Kapabacteria bacterium]|nr:T9SS type A sorting domain-containing protein [Candidatus Kapabacteria bacterium]